MTVVAEMKRYFRRRWSSIPPLGTLTSQAGTVLGEGLTASGNVDVQGSAALTAYGHMTASGSADVQGTAALTAYGNMTASGVIDAQASAALTAYGHMTASGNVDVQGSADLTAGELPTTNLTFHWDASSANNTVVSGEVTSLNDESGNGNHGTPGSGDNGGAVSTGGAPSGRDCISYNGTDESNMVASASGLPDGSDDRTWYWVGRVADLGATNWMFVTGTLVANQYFVVEMRQGTPDFARFTSGSEVLASDDSFDEWAVWCVKYDAGDLIMYKNGTQVASGTPTTLNTTFGDVRLGIVFSGDNKEQLFGELACYSGADDDTTRGDKESILGSRWGVTVS